MVTVLFFVLLYFKQQFAKVDLAAKVLAIARMKEISSCAIS